MRNFMEMLRVKWAEGKFVCVGLDSELEKIPDAAGPKDFTSTIGKFNNAIVNATADLVCAYKPNSAFYERWGGIKELQKTIEYIKERAPDVPIILDAKRADIGNTNNGYVHYAFEYLKADAITVNPYFGEEAMRPFLDRTDKGIIVLCRTSNPGAGEFQDLPIDGMPLYQIVASNVASRWNKNGNCAVVVGATYPEELAEVRKIVGNQFPILIPGIGKQGGDLEKTVQSGKDAAKQGMIINSSSGIIFASKEPDYAAAARHETKKLHDAITEILTKEEEITI